jgi:hypothetical protein
MVFGTFSARFPKELCGFLMGKVQNSKTAILTIKFKIGFFSMASQLDTE